MISKQKTEIIKSYFKDKPVKKAYIFGSYARNEEKPQSDIDILLDLDYENGADFFLFLDMQKKLSELLKNKVDLVSSSGLNKHIKPRIEIEKRLIYSQTNE